MNTAEDMTSRLLEKAGLDVEFRDRLIADPKGIIHEEFGIQVPDDVEIAVHQNDMNTIHLALPATELPEEQLEAISAGRCCCCV